MSPDGALRVGMLVLAGGTIKSWSNKQASIALSSGEAEFYAAGKGAVEVKGCQSLHADMGWHMQLRVCLDASAAQGFASRQGLGKTRHIEVRCLWIQDMFREKRTKLEKVWGKTNLTDVLTKAMASSEVFRLPRRVGVGHAEHLR